MDLLRLDTRGLSCPLPVLKAQKRLREMAPGARLLVLATDAKAVADFAHFCRASGHRLIETKEKDGVYSFLIERTG